MIPAVLKWASILCWATAAGFFAWYAVCVARQITYVTLADGRRQERRLPLIFRLLLPLTPNLETMVRSRGMEKIRGTADAMLVTAGYEGLEAHGVPPGVVVANAGDSWSPAVAVPSPPISRSVSVLPKRVSLPEPPSSLSLPAAPTA